MKTLVVIPARYASTRFPGKPLALLAGKPVIEWVWDNVAKVDAIDHAIVATDDQRIVDAVSHFGGNAMLTSPHHRSGTDRCGEVLQRLLDEGHKFDVVINVQGDEPFVSTAQLQSLIDTFATPEVDIATLRTRIATTDELLSANNVKVVSDLRGNALYFSRQPIPYIRGRKTEEWLQAAEYYKHVGIYAFRSHVLQKLIQLQPTALELSESLEQLRWLENGYRIAVRTTQTANIGIDTPEDLAAAESALRQHGSTAQ